LAWKRLVRYKYPPCSSVAKFVIMLKEVPEPKFNKGVSKELEI
jgi:hypothetical protein